MRGLPCVIRLRVERSRFTVPRKSNLRAPIAGLPDTSRTTRPDSAHGCIGVRLLFPHEAVQCADDCPQSEVRFRAHVKTYALTFSTSRQESGSVLDPNVASDLDTESVERLVGDEL